MISNRVIGYEKKPGRFILKENRQIRRKIYSSTDVLNRLDIREILFIM